MERSRAPVARDRFAPYRCVERPRARQHRQPSAEIRGGEMSCDACSKVLPISAEPAKSRNGRAGPSAGVHRRSTQAQCGICRRDAYASPWLDVLKAQPIPRAVPASSRRRDGGLWQVDVIRRHGQSNARQPGDATTCTDLCSPHRFGEVAPERVAEMVDVGQFLGLRAAKRAGPSAPAAGQLGIFASESEPIPQHAVRFSSWQIAALCMTLAAVASIPILLYPCPPPSDYINHVARMHVIATIGSDRNLALFYQVEWQVIPNLMMDLIVPILQRVMNVYLAGQVYTIMSFVLILSGTLALNRQLYRHWSVLPLIAFPLLYNNVFLVGTMNYLFGIGLALWALASWVALRERALILRLAVSSLFVLALFFCHLFAVGVYGLGLFAFELQRLLALRAREPLGSTSEHPAPRQLPAWVDFVASGIPFLPVVPLLLMSPTWTLRWDFTWEFSGKLNGLLFVIRSEEHTSELQ